MSLTKNLSNPTPRISLAAIAGGLKTKLGGLGHFFGNAPALALGVLVALYLAVGLADFLAPYGPATHEGAQANARPTPIYSRVPGQWWPSWPYVVETRRVFDEETLTFSEIPDSSRRYPVRFFVRGEPYHFLGLIPANIHLFGVAAPARLHLLGTDGNGRDVFSRLLFGGRISLTIGFLAIFIAYPLGLLYGGISGYAGGWLDGLMMRSAEILMSIPSLYLLISLAAVLPPTLSSTSRFTLVTLILAGIGWASLARVIRGMVLSIRQADFVEAAACLGASPLRQITRHVLPQTLSYVIVAITVGVPAYLLAESGLSFLGLGIQQPDASWGNMLKDAQSITALTTQPWLLAPGILIFITVLAFNVLGDAARDKFDPVNQRRSV